MAPMDELENLRWKIKNNEKRMELLKEKLISNKESIAARGNEHVANLHTQRNIVLSVLGSSLAIVLFGLPNIFGLDHEKPEHYTYAIFVSIALSIVVGIGMMFYGKVSNKIKKSDRVLANIKDVYSNVLFFLDTLQEAFIDATYDVDSTTIEEIDNIYDAMVMIGLITDDKTYVNLYEYVDSSHLSELLQEEIFQLIIKRSSQDFADAAQLFDLKLIPDSMRPLIENYCVLQLPSNN